MTLPQAALSTPDETATSIVSVPQIDKSYLEPRCRVCRNDEVRTKVNDLLASGASYAMTFRALGDDSAEGVTSDSISRHAERHFPVQNVAKATYREILERRAKENSVDFVEGVATAITPMALLETVMVRGCETLVDPDTKVDVKTGMLAASRLQELIDSREGQPDIIGMRAEMGRIINAVKEFIPREKWPELQAKVRGEPPPPSQVTNARVPQAPPVRVIPTSDRDEEE